MSRTIMITGASSGIGRATAELFMTAGWQVGLMARRAGKLKEVAGARDNAHIYLADVTDAGVVTEAMAHFAAAAGRLDVLFNNAGIFGPAGPIDEVPLEGWLEVMNTNINGMFTTARAAFAQMRRQLPQGGRIINNGSLSAHVPRAGAVCYTTSKHAITGLTKSLSLDGRPFDIACGQIDIGNARTELVEGLETTARAVNPDAELPPTMDVAEAARAVFHMAGLPPEANVQFMTVMATKMPYIGRG